MLDYDSFEKITPISLSVLEISDLILNYRTIAKKKTITIFLSAES